MLGSSCFGVFCVLGTRAADPFHVKTQHHVGFRVFKGSQFPEFQQSS